MSLKHKFKYILFLVLPALVMVIFGIIYLNSQQNEKNVNLTNTSRKDLRDLEYEELSPDGLNKIISYHFSFDTSIYRDYYRDYYNNDTVISVRDLDDGEENYIFTGNRIGFPKWLGNEYIFFTSYCGSSCQGIYLVNVFSKETRSGVLSSMTFEVNKPPYTVFRDWFGHDFKFDGWVDDIRSDTIGRKTYLIFYMRDDKDKSIGQKKFLFTGENLLEE